MKALTTLTLMMGSGCYSRGTGAAKQLRRPDSAAGGGDLTEDIEFWTRMTQEAGSIPLTDRPTPSPVAATPLPTDPGSPVTPIPTEPVDGPVTLAPITPAPTPAPVTPDTPEPSPGPSPEPSPRPSPEPSPEPSPAPTVDNTTPSPTTAQPTSLAPTQSPVGPCGITPEDRAEGMRQIALTVTSEAVLDDPASSQARALDWLVNEDALDPPLCPSDDGPCEAVQRYIMASFYYASGGGGWDQCNAPAVYTPAAIAAANADCERIVTPFPVSNPRIGDVSTDAWLTPVDECEWGGVACWGTNDERNGCMDQLDFENDGLSGSLISEMHNLEYLRFFILEQGSIAGQLPTEYGLFDNLLIFDMDFNALTGSIPDELFDMEVLQQLDLNDNNLSGPLSTKIGQLGTLTFLQLDHNSLSGNIPTQVGELGNLRIAFFNDNDFTGEMPSQACALRNNTNPPGLLGTLVTDCNPPNNPEVICSCCSSCNVIN